MLRGHILVENHTHYANQATFWLDQVSLNATQLQKCIWSRYDLYDLWPLTLTTFSEIFTSMIIICGKFHWNPSTKRRDIASLGIGVNEQRPDGRTDGQTDGRTDGPTDRQPEYMMLSAYYFWRRHKNKITQLFLLICLTMAFEPRSSWRKERCLCRARPFQ